MFLKKELRIKNVKTNNVLAKKTNKKKDRPHQHKVPYRASVTFDLCRVTLVGLFPLLAARARERGAAAAFIWRNTFPSIQAGLSTHSYSRETKTDKRNKERVFNNL